MKYRVTESHVNDNLVQIKIKCGERVRLGKRSDDNGNWPNWIYCYTSDGKSEGWTPVQILQTEGEYGIAMEDYSAEELSIAAGEIVNGVKMLNGWMWCSKLDGSGEGWLPLEKLVEI